MEYHFKSDVSHLVITGSYLALLELIISVICKHVLSFAISNCNLGPFQGSSTTHALLSMVHSWTKQTEGTGSTVRVVLLDYRKALDLIDHTILARKLTAPDIPQGITCWVIDLLKNRRQRVKLEQECKSEWVISQPVYHKGQNSDPGCLF